MAIKSDTFLNWMAVLGDRSGRRVTTPTLRVLYSLLDEQLGDEDFQAACIAWIAQSSFFPTPDELVALAPAHQKAELEAQRLYERAGTIMFGYAPPHITPADRVAQIRREAGEAASETVEATGVARWMEKDPATNEWLRKEFLTQLKARRAVQRTERLLTGHRAMAALRRPGVADQIAGERAKLIAAGSPENN